MAESPNYVDKKAGKLDGFWSMFLENRKLFSVDSMNSLIKAELLFLLSNFSNQKGPTKANMLFRVLKIEQNKGCPSDLLQVCLRSRISDFWKL